MSPIKNLTEVRRMPRIGKFHLGYMIQPKDETKSPYPRATDYFVYPTEGSPGFDLVPQLIKKFGEQPKSFSPIFFALDDEEAVASQYYRCYTRSRGLVCRGDGEVCNRIVDKKTGELPVGDTVDVVMKEMDCAGKECPSYQEGKCREVMNLQFMFKDISGIGIWQIDSSSINSMRNVNSCLTAIRSVFHRIDMVPLVLSLKEMEVIPPGGKKKKVHVLDVRSEDSLEEAMINSRKPRWELISGPADALQAERDIKELWEQEPKAMTTVSTEWPKAEQERMLNLGESATRMDAKEIEEAKAESEPEAKVEEPVASDKLEEELFGKPAADETQAEVPATQTPDASGADMYTEENIKTYTDLYQAVFRCWGLKAVEVWSEVNFKSVAEYHAIPRADKPSLYDIFLKIKAVKQ